MGADTGPRQWLPDPTIRATDGFRSAVPRGPAEVCDPDTQVSLNDDSDPNLTHCGCGA
jgi:hypothetical protein